MITRPANDNHRPYGWLDYALAAGGAVLLAVPVAAILRSLGLWIW